MSGHPNFIKGLQFTERFFDAVIKRAGGCRLQTQHKPPHGVKSTDYLINGFATELKILTSDPLDAVERQGRLEKFLRTELPKGPLNVTAHRREIAFRGDLSKAYWEKYIGTSVQDRLDSAAAQIRDTHTFVPGLQGGAVILVNAGGATFDWRSFIHLANHYQERFPEISVVFAVNGIPEREPDGQFHIHSGVIAKQSHRAEGDALAAAIEMALKEEIEMRTGKASKMVEADAKAPSDNVLFQLTPLGVKKKNPTQPLP